MFACTESNNIIKGQKIFSSDNKTTEWIGVFNLISKVGGPDQQLLHNSVVLQEN